MIEEQNGVCKICKNDRNPSKNLAVDHDHISKKIRGLLCLQCNTKLGWFETYKKEIVKYLM